jgi:hypothetical protein
MRTVATVCSPRAHASKVTYAPADSVPLSGALLLLVRAERLPCGSSARSCHTPADMPWAAADGRQGGWQGRRQVRAGGGGAGEGKCRSRVQPSVVAAESEY